MLLDMASISQSPFYGYLNEFVAECVQRCPDRFVGTALISIDWDDLTMLELETCNRRGLTALNITLEPLSLWTEPADEKAYTPVSIKPDVRFNASYMQRFWDSLSEWRWVLTLNISRRIPGTVPERILGDLEEVA